MEDTPMFYMPGLVRSFFFFFFFFFKEGLPKTLDRVT
jgi:hypothetical protein